MCRYVILAVYDFYLIYSLLWGHHFWDENKEKRVKEQSPLINPNYYRIAFNFLVNSVKAC